MKFLRKWTTVLCGNVRLAANALAASHGGHACRHCFGVPQRRKKTLLSGPLPLRVTRL